MPVVNIVDGINRIVSPTVLDYMNEYYGQSASECGLANGAELENNGDSGSAGSHWEGRLFGEEVMSASLVNQDRAILSGLAMIACIIRLRLSYFSDL